MKKWALLILSLILILSWAAAQDETYYDNSYARLSYVSGDTYVQRAQDLGLEAGTVNLAVIGGDALGTREGRLEIHFGQQNYLRMDRQSQVDVLQLPSRNLDYVKLHLKTGEVFLRISYLGEAQGFEIHTPDASFYVLEEGLYRLRSSQAGETELGVIEGSMEAAGEQASEVVRARERLVAADGRFILGPSPVASLYADAFSEWNRGRDALLAKPASSYLPEELSPYEGELADAGHWTYETPYGYVWVPHVYHDTWRPYCYGRWVWYPVCGYTWVSSYSWGWCVSHYGRWQWRFGLGWYWIPRCGWGPAWVHWHHGVHHYGWSALSYHGYPGMIINNHYYGDRYYGQYPADSRVMVTVRKDQLRDPEISRVALSRSQAKSMGKVQLSSRQPDAGAAAGASRGIGSARVSSRSSLKTYERTGSSRVSNGAISRSDSADASGRSAGPTARAIPSATGRSSRTAPQTYPSRSGATAGRAAAPSRVSETARAAPRTYPSRGSSVGRASPAQGGSTSRSAGFYPSRSTRDMSQQNLDRGVSGTVSRSYPSRMTRSNSRSTAGSVPSRPSGLSQNARSAPRSTSLYTLPSRTQSRGTASSRSVSRSGSSSSRGAAASSSHSSSSRVESSRRSSSLSSRTSYSGSSSSSRSSSVRSSPSRSASSSARSSGRSASSAQRSSGRTSGSGRTSSSSRSGSRVRKR